MSDKEPEDGRGIPSPEQAEWEEKLRLAREQRAKVLAAREATSPQDVSPPPPTGNISFESKLKAAREARERVLAEREVTPTPVADLSPFVAAAAPVSGPDTGGQPVSRVPLLGVAFAAALACAGVWWAMSGTEGPVPAPFVVPAGVELLVVSRAAPDQIAARLGDDGAYQLLPSSFAISRSRVEYFNESDLPAATQVATSVGAEIVDLRGIQPPQPEGRVFLYLSDTGG